MMAFPHLFHLANIFAMAIVAWLVPLLMVPVFIWLERKGSASIQDRLGPNRATILGFRLFGFLHNFADTVKLLLKENIFPARANRLAFFAGPSISMAVSLVPLFVVPFASPLPWGDETVWFQVAGYDMGLLILLAVSGLGVFGLLLGGWGSNNKFSLMGGLRSSSQFLSYELATALAVVGILMTYGDANLSHIVEAQGRPCVWFGHMLPIPQWGLFLQPIGFLLFLVGAFAETNRTPFDLPEGDSELVGGYHTEYSGMKFALFFMAEYSHMMVASIVLTTLFLGGYQVPFVSTEALRSHPREILYALSGGMAGAGLALGALFFAMGRHKGYEKGFSRYEMYVYAFSMLALAALAIASFVFLPGLNLPLWLPGPLAALTQFSCLMAKAMFFCWLFVWVRWTLPRFRFDQLTGLGWKILLPLGLANVALTAAWVIWGKS